VMMMVDDGDHADDDDGDGGDCCDVDDGVHDREQCRSHTLQLVCVQFTYATCFLKTFNTNSIYT
jgi:hypothetical protein